MKKLLKWHDAYTLKILVSCLILFTALYPKLPSIHIDRTWVYVRLEDFLISGTVLVWFIQLVRRKVSLPRIFVMSIGLYWVIGLISVVFSILFIAPTLAGFFPHVAILSFLRRIEYMILFFVAFSTVKSAKDVRDYFIVLATTVMGVFMYGLGQRYYISIWEAAPEFFRKYPFCFPSFQTGNEEFAKGLPLCLQAGARITSTFGGSYDLAAYLVLVLPVILGVFLAIKKWYLKAISLIIFICGLMLLIFTAQRAAFIAYIIGSTASLVMFRKKLYIIPLFFISIALLLVFSESTAKRFLSTLRVSSVVVDSQGKLIGQELPDDLKERIEKPVSGTDLPQGSAFLGLPNSSELATSSAMIKRPLTPQETKRLQLAEGSLQISTVTGSFLVKKVLVYDISFTTRFQAEWPNAWRAFMRNPLLGSGYSSITLATDNDYFRALGETGLLGLLSFMGIFLVFGITLKRLSHLPKSPLVCGFSYGVGGGVVGLALNAILIDVFEASKVAENLWILLGIATGGLMIYQTKPIAYKKELVKILTSNKAYIVYLLSVIGAFFFSSAANFFVADDFTWLKWAATDTLSNLPTHFINAQNFFYRPLDKVVTYILYTLFSFQPQGYHVFILFLHFLSTMATYILSKKILKNNLSAFLTAIIFALLPVHAENIYWFSGLSGMMASTFILYAAIAFYKYREKKSRASYVLALVLSILALFSYEMAIIAPLTFIVVDFILFKAPINKKTLVAHIPFLLLMPGYYLLRIVVNAFSGGGDYSYSMVNLVPNVIGNVFGYLGLFTFGNYFLPIYNSLRNNMRDDKVQFAIFAFVAIFAVVSIVYFFRKKISASFKSDSSKQIIFGFVFAFVSLIPFLALGNIAPRYLYLGSFGLCLALIVIIHKIFKKSYVVIILVLILAFWYQTENYKLQKDWNKAGEITKNALAVFRIDYEHLDNSDTIYIVGTPVMHNNVWVFPVGFTDGMWFIYRERIPSIYQVSSIDQAKKDIQRMRTKKNHIFKFDKDGKLSEVNPI